MEALRVGRMYIRKLTPEQRNMKKDEVEYEINKKEGAYEDLFKYKIVYVINMNEGIKDYYLK